VIELVVRVVFSLAVVLGLLWFIARTSSRRLGGSARSMVRVVARQPLARSASLAVVEVGDRLLVVGVSENGVSLLTEMDPAELPETVAPGSTAPALDSPAQAQVAAHRAQTSRLGVLSGQTWRQAWAAATQRTGVTVD
jgi:flagellar protein FliO/FliZ